jgi:release factor glutamine methyltransferase
VPAPPPEIVARLRAAGCVWAEEEALLLAGAATGAAELEALVARRAGGEPLEHVVGWAEFCGLRVAVAAGVFVPRRRSEFLVERACAVAPAPAAGEGRGLVVVDMCCGSGALGLAVAVGLGRLGHEVELHAADVDPASVRCAAGNLARVGGRAYEGDLFDPLPAGLRGRVDIVVANAPYVPSAAVDLLPAEARLHEPRIALDGGADGLHLARRLAAGARAWLAPGGSLLVEASEAQAGAAAEGFVQAGFIAEAVFSDEWDSAVVIGR